MPVLICIIYCVQSSSFTLTGVRYSPPWTGEGHRTAARSTPGSGGPLRPPLRSGISVSSSMKLFLVRSQLIYRPTSIQKALEVIVLAPKNYSFYLSPTPCTELGGKRHLSMLLPLPRINCKNHSDLRKRV